MVMPNKYNSTRLFKYIDGDNESLDFIRNEAISGLALVHAKSFAIIWMDDACYSAINNNNKKTDYIGNTISIIDDKLLIDNERKLKGKGKGKGKEITEVELSANFSLKIKYIDSNEEENKGYCLIGLSQSKNTNINLEKNQTAEIALLRSVLNDEPTYIFRVDELGKLVFKNSAFKNTFIGANDVHNSTIQQCIHPKDIALLNATFKSAKEQIERRFPIRLRLKRIGTEDYQLVELDFQAIPKHINGSKKYYFQASGKKANEATLTKAHLIDKNLELSSIQQALYNSAIIAVGNLEGVILDVNDRFCEVSGHTKEELIGRNFSSLSATKKPKNSWAEFWKTIDLDDYWRGQICNKNKVGEQYWLDTVMSLITSSHGNIKKFISISQDITNIKSIQATLKLTSDQLEQTGKLARVGGWELNLVTSELSWSSVTKEIHQVPQSYIPELATALNFYKEGIDRERILKLVQNAIESGTTYDEEFRIITAKGHERWVRVIGEAEFESNKCVRVYGVFQDIHQLKQTQISDALNATRLEVAADYSGIGIWEYDGKTQKEYWDEQMLSLHRYKREEYDSLSDPWDKIVHPEDFERANKEFRDSLKTGDNYDSIYRIVWPNGEIKFIHAKGRIFRDDKDQVVSIIGTNQDITEQKKLEDELRYNQYIFEQSGKLAKIGSWVVNLGRTKSVEWSNITQEIHGVADDYVPYFNKVDHFYHFEGSSTDIKKLYALAIRSKKGFDIEFRLKTFDGDIRWVRSIAHPEFDDKGKCLRIIGTLQDITKQREEAERLKAAEKLAGLGTFQYYVLTDELYWSDIAREIYEIDKEQLTFQDYTNRIHKDDRQKAESDFRNAVENKADFRYSHRLVMDDGRVKYGTFTGENIYDANGVVYLSRGTIEDITKEKVAELELIKSRTEAIEANKAKSNFLANMSHEIRTPLNGVIGFNELLSHTPLNEIQQQYLQNASSSAQTLLSVLNDILDFSKIEAGKLELDPTKTDLIEVIQSTANIFKYAAQKKNLEILLDIKPDLPSEVIVDQLRLKQILTNLLSNAVKFTDHGNLKIEVDFKRLKSTKNKKVAKFTFKTVDTGIGISKAQRLKLFKAFSQADPSTSRKYGGTGLGLVISNSILDQMGTRLKMNSELGIGSTFFFDLILEYGYSENTASHTIDHIKNALIVDDNIEATRILKTQLAHWGISSVTAHNAEEAIKYFHQDLDFDVAILDYHMPDKTGLELLAEVKRSKKSPNKNTPVILLHSSADDANILLESNKSGVYIRLEKPLYPTELYRALTKINEPSESFDSSETSQALRANHHKVLDTVISPNILIVEDVLLNSTLVKALIKRYLPSANVSEVVNGVDAVEYCKNNHVDLIFMDIQMPIMDGYEATKEIRAYEAKQQKEAVTIVALTAHAFKEERDKVLTIGMNDLLTKPVEPLAISKTLSTYFKINNAVDYSSIEEGLAKVADAPKNQIYDKTAVLNRFLFDEELISEMLQKAKTQILATKELLMTAIKEKDADQIEKTAHKIKGIAKNMSFVKLIETASILEAKSDESTNIIGELYENLDESINELLNYLKI